MDDLSGASDRTSWRGPLRLAGALALLLAGVMVLAAGVANVGADVLVAAGLARTVAVDLALGLAAILPPVVLFGVIASVDAPTEYRRYALAGAIVATVGIGAGLLLDGAVANRGAAVLYALGFLLALVALAGSFLADESSGQTRSTPGYTRSTGSVDRVTPADGGADDDDLSFPLDDEE